jgi:hypothetical protein
MCPGRFPALLKADACTCELLVFASCCNGITACFIVPYQVCTFIRGVPFKLEYIHIHVRSECRNVSTFSAC